MSNSSGPVILVLGATGMLGNTMLRCFSQSKDFRTFGTVRSSRLVSLLPDFANENLIEVADATSLEQLNKLFEQIRPDVVINCVGIVKQLSQAKEPLPCIQINALFPHQLAELCGTFGARMIHVSTDCVFNGSKGGYIEADIADSLDLYGRTKYLGEVHNEHSVTLRTSIIGHELNSAVGLLCWFLRAEGRVKGFCQAYFSGLPTIELAEIIRDKVIPNPKLSGLYHVASDSISKHDLLVEIADVYRKNIDIIPDDSFRIDRSLDATRFFDATGYRAPKWRELIEKMEAFR